MKNISHSIINAAVRISFMYVVLVMLAVSIPQTAAAADYNPSYASSIDYSYSSYPSYASSVDYSYSSYSPSYSSSIDYSYPLYSPSYASSIDYTYSSYSPSYASSVDYTYPAYSPSYASSIDYSYPATYDTYSAPSYTASTYSNAVDYVGGSSFGGSGYGGGVDFIGGSWFGPTDYGCGLLGCSSGGCSKNCGGGYYEEPRDVCPNLSGRQSYVPDGYELKNGKCTEAKHYTPSYPTYREPYVTLNQVPYTGLDLGPVGTAVYFSLFALVAFFLFYVGKMALAYRAMKRG